MFHQCVKVMRSVAARGTEGRARMPPSLQARSSHRLHPFTVLASCAQLPACHSASCLRSCSRATLLNHQSVRQMSHLSYLSRLHSRGRVIASTSNPDAKSLNPEQVTAASAPPQQAAPGVPDIAFRKEQAWGSSPKVPTGSDVREDSLTARFMVTPPAAAAISSSHSSASRSPSAARANPDARSRIAVTHQQANDLLLGYLQRQCGEPAATAQGSDDAHESALFSDDQLLSVMTPPPIRGSALNVLSQLGPSSSSSTPTTASRTTTTISSSSRSSRSSSSSRFRAEEFAVRHSARPPQHRSKPDLHLESSSSSARRRALPTSPRQDRSSGYSPPPPPPSFASSSASASFAPRSSSFSPQRLVLTGLEEQEEDPFGARTSGKRTAKLTGGRAERADHYAPRQRRQQPHLLVEERSHFGASSRNQGHGYSHRSEDYSPPPDAEPEALTDADRRDFGKYLKRQDGKEGELAPLFKKDQFSRASSSRGATSSTLGPYEKPSRASMRKQFPRVANPSRVQPLLKEDRIRKERQLTQAESLRKHLTGEGEITAQQLRDRRLQAREDQLREDEKKLQERLTDPIQSVPVTQAPFDVVYPKSGIDPAVLPKNPRRLTVSLVGTPNVGKSSIVNELVGHKVSAVSTKSQTTRSLVRGVLTKDDTQIVFTDSPGFPTTKRKQVNPGVLKACEEALREQVMDAVMVVLDISREQTLSLTAMDVIRRVAKEYERRQEIGEPFHLTILMNKSDHLHPRLAEAKYERLRNKIAGENESLKNHIFLTTITDRNCMNALRSYLLNLAVDGDWKFPPDAFSDRSKLETVEEVIREKIYQRFNLEVPYTVQQENRGWTELPNGDLRIDQALIVKKRTHINMLVGQKGEALLWVLKRSRADLTAILGRHVHLYLIVDWDGKQV